MATSQIVLEYMKVVLSAPVVAGVVTLVMAAAFRAEIRRLIGRVAHIKLPGGGELSTSQLEKTQEALSPAPGKTAISAVPADEKLPALPPVPEADAARIEQLVRSERANAILWEYRFLNFFLARVSQVVLDWLATKPPISMRQFDSELMALVDNPQEREAIFKALTNHYLAQVKDDLIEITPKGREYLGWRGPLQQPRNVDPPALSS